MFCWLRRLKKMIKKVLIVQIKFVYCAYIPLPLKPGLWKSLFMETCTCLEVWFQWVSPIQFNKSLRAFCVPGTLLSTRDTNKKKEKGLRKGLEIILSVLLPQPHWNDNVSSVPLETHTSFQSFTCASINHTRRQLSDCQIFFNIKGEELKCYNERTVNSGGNNLFGEEETDSMSQGSISFLQRKNVLSNNLMKIWVLT